MDCLYLKTLCTFEESVFKKMELVDLKMLLEMNVLFPFRMVWANDVPLSGK